MLFCFLGREQSWVKHITACFELVRVILCVRLACRDSGDYPLAIVVFVGLHSGSLEFVKECVLGVVVLELAVTQGILYGYVPITLTVLEFRYNLVTDSVTLQLQLVRFHLFLDCLVFLPHSLQLRQYLCIGIIRVRVGVRLCLVRVCLLVVLKVFLRFEPCSTDCVGVALKSFEKCLNIVLLDSGYNVFFIRDGFFEKRGNPIESLVA